MSAERVYLQRLGAIAACIAATLATSSAVAQVASAQIVEGGVLPGMPGETVDSISNSAVNHAGGYAFTVNSSGSGVTLSHAWGNPLGGPGSVMRTEGVFGDYDQGSFESFFGVPSDPYTEVSRFHNEPHHLVISAELFRSQDELDSLLLSRFKEYFPESFQLFYRSNKTCNHIADV